jgi:hypothetical protein
MEYRTVKRAVGFVSNYKPSPIICQLGNSEAIKRRAGILYGLVLPFAKDLT